MRLHDVRAGVRANVVCCRVCLHRWPAHTSAPTRFHLLSSGGQSSSPLAHKRPAAGQRYGLRVQVQRGAEK